MNDYLNTQSQNLVVITNHKTIRNGGEEQCLEY